MSGGQRARVVEVDVACSWSIVVNKEGPLSSMENDDRCCRRLVATSLARQSKEWGGEGYILTIEVSCLRGRPSWEHGRPSW